MRHHCTLFVFMGGFLVVAVCLMAAIDYLYFTDAQYESVLRITED